VFSEEERDNGAETLFEEIIAENFHNLEKETHPGLEPLGVTNKMNSTRNNLRHIVVKMVKVKHKERILKTAREKKIPGTSD